MPKIAFYFFILAGAGFALGTTLNATIAMVTKPVMQACEDGWFPRVLATLHPTFKSPFFLLALFYIINLIPVFLNYDISQIGQWVLFLGNIVAILNILGVMRLPKLFPEQWAKSPYRVPEPVLKGLLILSALVAAYQAYLNGKGAGSQIARL